MVLTAHTGNWDFLAAYIIKSGIPISTAAKAARNPTLQNVLAYLRDRYGIKTIWREPGISPSKRILEELKNKQIVAGLIDQDTKVSSVYAPFFDLQTKTPSGLVALGKRASADIYTCFIFRKDNNNFAIHLDKIDSKLDINQTLEDYNKKLESCIKLYPSQWVWFHKRWRSLPEGKTLSTQKYLTFLKEKLAK